MHDETTPPRKKHPVYHLKSNSGRHLCRILHDHEVALLPSIPEGQDYPLNRYSVVGELGTGGMAVVLEARDHALQRDVAVKLSKPKHSGKLSNLLRFVEEAQITGQLEHPNIIPIYELNRTETGNVYYSMKRISGHSLRDIIHQLADENNDALKTYSLNDLLTIFVKVCNAVSYAHSRGVIHRDIKPANIMVGDFGEVLLLDWGIARVTGQPDARDDSDHPGRLEIETTARDEITDLTQTGMISGTPGYAAPEQLFNCLDADERSDVYSLACTLYAILCLKTPGAGYDAKARIIHTVEGTLPSIHDMVSNRAPKHLPNNAATNSLADIVTKGMALEPSMRYSTVAEMADDINAYLSGQATSFDQNKPLRRLWLLARRNVVESIIACVACAVLLVSSVLVVMSLKQKKDKAAENVENALVAAAQSKEDKKRNVGYLVDIEKAAPAFAELAQVNLTREDKRRRALPNLERLPQRFRLDCSSALSNLDVAIKLRPTDPNYWYLQGMILQNPTVVMNVITPPPKGVLSGTTFTFHFSEAIEAFENALKFSEHLDPSKVRRAKEELQFTIDLQKQAKAGETALVLARLTNWMGRNGRQKEVNILKPILYDWNNASLEERRPELIKCNLYFWKPGADEFFGHNIMVIDQSAGPVNSFRPLKGMVIDSLKLGRPVSQDLDLTPLKDASFRELFFTGARDGNLSFLKSSSLERLELKDCRLTSIDFLRGMESLRQLHVLAPKRERAPLTDLTPLTGLPLNSLTLVRTQIEAIDAIESSALRELNLRSSPVRDLSVLKGAPLVTLYIEGTRVESLRPLSESPIEILNASGTRITSLTGLNVSRLKSLSIAQCPVNSLDGLQGAKLVTLFIDETDVSDISILKGMPLRLCSASKTKLTTLDAFRGMNLDQLDISRTGVTDLTPLKGMELRWLKVTGCNIADFSPIADLPLNELIITNAQASTAYPVIKGMDTLVTITVSGKDYEHGHFLKTFGNVGK